MKLPVRVLLITSVAAIPAALAACGDEGGALETLPPIVTTTTTTVPPTTVDTNRYFRTIQPGENLNMIAQALCVPISQLIELNQAVIPDPNNVPAGATIEIPANMVMIGCTPTETIKPTAPTG